MMMRFIRDERGATAIEYALIAAMLSVAIIASVTLLGDALKDTFDDTAAKVAAAT
ncbi:Flp family type IVb pilin [Terricaulis sp.]|jgi:pilus assembly protein Flp/PilA|uniref:Flp family type IVb pilin n=1 Tax=Terricaulis sp. TaxID=2768686 RepID=UPI002AC62FB0|nr:Flp family type IVb pilin [Terricaulis sp.]MDZ4690706.1 Flp family type IVb pilin [Terricaulis sp.]